MPLSTSTGLAATAGLAAGYLAYVHLRHKRARDGGEEGSEPPPPSPVPPRRSSVAVVAKKVSSSVAVVLKRGSSSFVATAEALTAVHAEQHHPLPSRKQGPSTKASLLCGVAAALQ